MHASSTKCLFRLSHFVYTTLGCCSGSSLGARSAVSSSSQTIRRPYNLLLHPHPSLPLFLFLSVLWSSVSLSLSLSRRHSTMLPHHSFIKWHGMRGSVRCATLVRCFGRSVSEGGKGTSPNGEGGEKAPPPKGGRERKQHPKATGQLEKRKRYFHAHDMTCKK